MRKVILAGLAAGMAALAAPPPATADGALGGFVANATAAPLKIEVYEPSIPIPAQPQAELSVGFTRTKADTGPSGRGRASWLWPGNSVGDGFKTFGDALGLPAALTERGYPLQVNAETPGGPDKAADEPAPGMVMRASATAQETVAKVGLTADGEVEDGEGGSQEEGPELPEPLGGLGGQGHGVDGLSGQAGPKPGTAAAAEPATPGLPPELAALVDFGQLSSISRSRYAGDTVIATGTTRLADVSLLGGLITADSMLVSATTTSSLDKTASTVKATYAGLAVAGNGFTVGKNGVEAAGQQSDVPGLPDDPAKALEALGVRFELPEAQKTVDGHRESVALQGMRVVVDVRALRSKLDSSAVDALLAELPEDANRLQGMLAAVVHFAPEIVVHLGSVRTEASALRPMELPPVPPAAGEGGGSGDEQGEGGASGAVGAGGGTGGTDTTAAGPPTTTDVPVATTQTPAAGLQPAAGLPALGSVPGMLILAGLGLASVLGWWLQKVGAGVLGGGASCPSGLETGIPDLRKA